MYEEDRPKEYAAEPSGSSRLPLSHQEKAIAELHDTINQLATRLKSVLTPVSEAVDKMLATETEKETRQSPLADQLETNNRGISKASTKLRSLMERLEC